MSWTSESTIKQAAFPIYIAVTIMLIVVEMVGFVGKGAQRWIDLGFIRLQPSEFMKPGIVLVLARFYELLPAGDIRKWRAIWPAAALIGFPVALIMLQPDLGTALMVTFIGVTVMFVAGVPFRVFLIPGVALARRHPRRLPDAARLPEEARSTSSSTRKATRWAPVITSASRRSRSDRAASSGKAISMAARATSTIFPRATPISSSPRWSKNGAWSAAPC